MPKNQVFIEPSHLTRLQNYQPLMILSFFFPQNITVEKSYIEGNVVFIELENAVQALDEVQVVYKKNGYDSKVAGFNLQSNSTTKILKIENEDFKNGKCFHILLKIKNQKPVFAFDSCDRSRFT